MQAEVGRAEVGPDPRESLHGRVVRRFVNGNRWGALDPGARIAAIVAEEAPLLAPGERSRLVKELTDELLGLGRIVALLEDPDVTDVLVNGPGTAWVERCGVLQESEVELTRAEIQRVIERLIAPLGLRCDRANPITHGRLDDGTRVTVVLDPISVEGPSLALRRHSPTEVPLESFAADSETLGLLCTLVQRRANVVVHGATGSGKTTLVNSLAALVPSDERIIVIEDVAELRIQGEQVVRLETRDAAPSNPETAVDQRTLVRTALRMRPDRLIVGEVRGPEALDMIWAMSSGHTGCMSTCHAHSAEGAIARLETMAVLATGEALGRSAVRAQILDAVDYFVGVARGVDGRRKVNSISQCSTDGISSAITPIPVKTVL